MYKPLYSERLRQQRAAPDVLEYDQLGGNLRVKIQYAMEDLLSRREIYRRIAERLRREFGVRNFGSSTDNYFRDLMYLITKGDVPQVLDTVEMVSREALLFNTYGYDLDVEAFESTLNFEFRRHAVGYQIHNGEVTRVDNTYTHAEVTKPALVLLSDKRWSGAEEEFRKAHEH